MQTISTRLPDDEANDLDRIILVKRLQGEDITKAGVLRELTEEWIDEHRHVLDDVDFDD